MSKRKSFEKPSDCAICYEKLEDTEAPLVCGHYLHLSCLKKHFKPECAICRHPLSIEVSGELPFPENDVHIERFPLHQIHFFGYFRGFLDPHDLDLNELEQILDFQERYYNEDDELPPLEDVGEYNVQNDEDDEEYDEENPHGDTWNYEDV